MKSSPIWCRLLKFSFISLKVSSIILSISMLSWVLKSYIIVFSSWTNRRVTSSTFFLTLLSISSLMQNLLEHSWNLAGCLFAVDFLTITYFVPVLFFMLISYFFASIFSLSYSSSRSNFHGLKLGENSNSATMKLFGSCFFGSIFAYGTGRWRVGFDSL